MEGHLQERKGRCFLSPLSFCIFFSMFLSPIHACPCSLPVWFSTRLVQENGLGGKAGTPLLPPLLQSQSELSPCGDWKWTRNLLLQYDYVSPWLITVRQLAYQKWKDEPLLLLYRPSDPSKLHNGLSTLGHACFHLLHTTRGGGIVYRKSKRHSPSLN